MRRDKQPQKSPTDGRYERLWRFANRCLHGYFERKFSFRHDSCTVDAPCLVISNHVTNWDPVLVALSFPNNPLYYVASEHIFRWGIFSRLIDWLAAPISRSKGASGARTAMTCIQRLRSGNSVGLFAEGDRTWNGRSQPIVPSTGKFAKMCGATLVTYRLEGLYLSLPRWGSGLRRGRTSGGVVGIYPPERLAQMSAQEINDAINRDLCEDALERCAAEGCVYDGKAMAEHLEIAMFICPECGGIGGLVGDGNQIKCSCGFSRTLNGQGRLEPDAPFATLLQWDQWQRERFSELISGGGELFADDDVTLSEIGGGHRMQGICTDTLIQYGDSIACGGIRFALSEITSMAIADTSALVFTCKKKYYELHPKARCCLRKYLMAWQLADTHNTTAKENEI